MAGSLRGASGLEGREPFFRLADRLDATGDPKYQKLIENLNGLEYDDFANNKYAAPKMKMVEHLRAVGLETDAQDVIDGKYDQ